MAEETGKCDVCQKIASHKCGGCHEVYYCGKEHQKAGWKVHKKFCKPFKIQTDDILGRHLRATKDIKPNSVVLQEPPLIWGPAQHTTPVCLGCCKPLTESTSRPCSKCGWPMCSEICEKAPCHIPECRYTVLRGDKVSITNFGIIHPSYQCITVLRCLYQKQFLPETWKKLDQLESHCDVRKNTLKYEQERLGIAQFILRFFKLDAAFTEEEIMRVCGIVTVNSHEVPLTEPSYIAIYENTSMFEHNCSPNCSKSFTNDGRVLISSGFSIKKGDHLSINYTDPLWGTPSRRHHLQESKFFWCTCPRCSDPTEFGTYFSALRCQDSGCKGYLLPKTFLDNSVNERGLDWYCNNCSISLSSYAVQDLLERIGKDLADMPKGIAKECKSFIETYEELLHKNHYYLTDVKIALAQQIGQEDEMGISEVSDDDLNLKVKLCQELVILLKSLAPAEKRILGPILFELHAAITETGKRKGEPEIFHAALLESRRLLSEVVELLKYEPSLLPEGKIFEQSVTNLKDIDLVLKTVHKAVGDAP